LGSPAYLTSKMSSTLVSSLITGTPVVADAAMLGAYTFLGREDVFFMNKGEDEVDVMLRVRPHRAWGLPRRSPCPLPPRSLPVAPPARRLLGQPPHTLSPLAAPSSQVLRKSPAEIYAVHRRVAALAASLNNRTASLLRGGWLPGAAAVVARHEELGLPVAPALRRAASREAAAAAAARAGEPAEAGAPKAAGAALRELAEQQAGGQRAKPGARRKAKARPKAEAQP
jgi:hypothetical protein